MTAHALLHPTACISNSNNHCYANTVLLCLNWTMMHLPATQDLWAPAMQSIMQRMSSQARLPDLWSFLPWSMLHSRWHRPHVQHDAAEYLHFARRYIIPHLVHGGWQRRLLDHDATTGTPICEVRDRGETWPLLLAVSPAQLLHSPDHPLPLQTILHHWYTQAADGITALDSAPPLLAVQVNRFGYDGTRPLRDLTPIHPDPCLTMQCFSSDADALPASIEMQPKLYYLRAIIVHEGASPASGHYRALLYSQCERYRHSFCDDGKSPRLLQELPALAFTNGYVYLYQLQ